ncbi:hypothetical protein [Apilactobacillus timberlakei]|uniref:Transcriptional regulator n=1 Tax=Apilactobacillus timberlakei TaxID=2008380 RepID=A0ABY2YVB2_9LACO|nr:hypothetical protein [Apilactobacillus timberlakei]TPR12428.1 hypothetical protein DY048_07710 [Apilactobacillus timberlakei]TPR12968.1 hypothetical protein DY052_08630 [Apilactobacillus timberlakei]
MQRSTINFIEELLRDYPKIPEYIERKKQDIKYPFNANRDDNVGGGQGHSNNTSPTERIVLKIDDCDFINAFQRQEAAIDKSLAKCDPSFISVIKEYYFDEYNAKTLPAVAANHGYSNPGIYRERKKFFKDVMRNLGLHHYIERDEIIADKQANYHAKRKINALK